MVHLKDYNSVPICVSVNGQINNLLKQSKNQKVFDKLFLVSGLFLLAEIMFKFKTVFINLSLIPNIF